MTNQTRNPMESRRRVEAFIFDYWMLHEQSPTQDEIAEGTHLSQSYVCGIVAKLECEGLIKRIPGVPRSIVVK